MKIRTTFIAIIITSLVIALSLLASYYWNKYELEHLGDLVVRTVEEFKVTHGRLPNSRSEMGLPDSETTTPYYTKHDDGTYDLFYPFGFDDGLLYRSTTKKWENYPPES
jgi:hypothetical protein